MKVAVIRVSELNKKRRHMCEHCRAIIDEVHVTNGDVQVKIVPYLPKPSEEDLTLRLEEMRKSSAAESGMTEDQLVARTNSQRYVQARRKFAMRAREEGYSFPAIGRALGMHHSTIMHLVRGG